MMTTTIMMANEFPCTTRANDVQALSKLRAFVDSLDRDSYLAYAFDGFFEIAESNISSGTYVSVKESLDLAYADAEDVRKQSDHMEDLYLEALRRRKETIHALEKKLAETKRELARLKSHC